MSGTVGSMIRLRRQRPSLEAILKEANRNRKQEMLEHANADQINAVSEMVLNLLRNRISVYPSAMAKLQRYKTTLREVGKRRNSVKRRRAHLFQSMLCSIKGRDEKGYPLEGVDVVPEHKGKRKPLYSKEQDFHAGKIESS